MGTSRSVEERLAALAVVRPDREPSAAELEGLVECLGDDEKRVQRRAADVCALLAATQPVVRARLAAALSAATTKGRWGAAFALGKAGAPVSALTPTLLEALGAADGDVRWASAQMLVSGGASPALVGSLCGLMGTGNAVQRKMALYCLRDLGARGPQVEALILAALADDEIGVQMAALSAMVALATDRELAAQRALDALHHHDPRLQRAAAAALGSLGRDPPAVRAALERASHGTADLSLARAASRALQRLDAVPPA